MTNEILTATAEQDEALRDYKAAMLSTDYQWELLAIVRLSKVGLYVAKAVEMIDNGYEVERSPHDDVREYYSVLERSEYHADFYGHDREVETIQYAKLGIRKTLDMLDIKIEGVNA